MPRASHQSNQYQHNQSLPPTRTNSKRVTREVKKKMTTSPNTMTPSERVRAALAGEPVDRVPFCFWHHFKPEGSGERLAQMTYEFFREKFDLDIVKIMPDLPYPAPDPPISQTTHWRTIPRLGLDTSSFAQQLVCIRSLRARLG